MKRYVVDTNVPIVANGRTETDQANQPSIDCRASSIKFLQNLLEKGKVVLDVEGAIQEEYARHLKAKGQPGVGDLFFREIINSSPIRVERSSLKKLANGEYLDLPAALMKSSFDPSDRKFAALAKQQDIPVANAVDSDWLEHLETLKNSGIKVQFVCGCNSANWFE